VKTVTRALGALGLIAFWMLPAAATAQILSITAGLHYEVIDPPAPVTTTDRDRIEVTEVFWYGCPRCFVFEPMMHTWQDRMRGDLAFTRVPGVWHQVMETHARLYYAAGALGAQSQRRIHQAAFRAIHERGSPLGTEDEIRVLFLEQGVSEEDFDELWSSPAVHSAVGRAMELTADYGLQKLPSLIVNGRYRIAQNAAVRTHDDMLVVAHLLLREIRSLRRTDLPTEP
jgi:protein dithiol oxidoreductase (disulfide-forming)